MGEILGVAGLFLLGLTWPFWFFVAICIGAITCDCIDELGEFPVLPIVCSVIFGAAWWWVTGTNIMKAFFSNWTMILVYIGTYLGLGVAWSFFKWIRFLYKVRDRVQKVVAEAWVRITEKAAEYQRELTRYISLDNKFKSNFPNNPYPVEEDKAEYVIECVQRDRLLKNALDEKDVEKNVIRPKVTYGDNWKRVTGWMAFWPFSLINYIFGKLIKEIYDFIATLCKRAYQAIADYIFKDVNLNQS